MRGPGFLAAWIFRVIANTKLRRGVIATVIFIVYWETASRTGISRIPAPTAVAVTFNELMREPSYWFSWYLSTQRVFAGFIAAMLLVIPLGLGMAVSRAFYGTVFPVFEVLRPIPPLAWVPASIIFWPTQEMSIAFVTFLGAFYAVVINVIGGAQAIDVRYYQAARSMGSSSWDIFRRITFPGTVPSILVGAEVGMGITWAIVVAGEMIAGGGDSLSGTAGGLGYFIWTSYVGSSFPDIIVGMFSIGIGGFLSSAALRAIGKLATPYLRQR